ncbi:hypothetical protein G6F50_014226 [Rhizopus delemar]|uniref:Uncharacterized protein n=1 Tax=Rhizopus delemar TaxID=936053 RepID=A0A9P6Y8C7_9FUNG|nr:hypothetical protein G6F50_014226 [Rhizopus delemar]
MVPRGVTAREVAAGGAAVGHEQRVAGEQRIADQVGDAVAGVAGHGDHLAAQFAKRKDFAIAEQVVEDFIRSRKLQAVARRKSGLHRADAFADGQRGLRKALLEPAPGRHMVGVGVRFQQPAQLQALLFNGLQRGMQR